MKYLNEKWKYKSINRFTLQAAHMEGPFLSEKYVGANKEKNICKPSIFALNERNNTLENDIAIVT